MGPPPPRSSRLVARVGAALHALLIGVALRAMAPHAPWWVEVAVYAALAATGWWGVRVAERHPDEEPRQYGLRGARWIVAACLTLAGTGFGAMLTSRTQSVSTLVFAFTAIAALLALVAVGVVALGCAAGRVVTAAGDAPHTSIGPAAASRNAAPCDGASRTIASVRRPSSALDHRGGGSPSAVCQRHGGAVPARTRSIHAMRPPSLRHTTRAATSDAAAPPSTRCA